MQTGKHDRPTQSSSFRLEWATWQLEGAKENYLKLRSVHLLLSFVLLGHEKQKIKNSKLQIKGYLLTSTYFVQ